MENPLKHLYQHLPVVSPAKWAGDERRFALRIEHLFDEVYAKLGLHRTEIEKLKAAGGGGSIGNLTVSAETLEPGTPASADITTGEDGQSIAFGIPKGEKGEKGDKGDKGDPGGGGEAHTHDAADIVSGTLDPARLPAADGTDQGAMSAADYTKLAGIEAGAQVNPGAATSSAAGLMSAADKAKLDGIEAGANAYTLPIADASTLGGIRVNQSEGFSVNSSGDLIAERAGPTYDGFMTSTHYNKLYMLPTAAELAANYQAKLVSGTNIKTLNSTSLLGSGDITLTASDVGAQPTLVSGTNIKTINNQSLLGSGNITIQGGGGSQYATDIEMSASDPTTVAAAIAAVPRATIEQIYPVGAVYISLNSTNPGALFGFGTWSRILGKFLLAADDRTYLPAAQGGEATHTLTTDEMPSHTHTVNSPSGNPTAYIANQAGSIGGSGKNIISKPILPTGGGQAHNNMPPYYAVYMWERTA